MDILSIIALILSPSCVVGIVYFLYKAIRLFVEKKPWRAVLNLVPFLLGFCLFYRPTESVFIIITLILILSCVGATFYQFFKAIRLFAENKHRKAVLRLALSFWMALVAVSVFSVCTAFIWRESVSITIVLILFLSCVVGTFCQSYKAIRLFKEKKHWEAGLRLILSFLLVLVVFCFIASFMRAREKAKRCTCSNNLKQITLFIMTYSHDHHGAYPETLGVLKDYIRESDKSVFICPSSGHQAGSLTNIDDWTDYAYMSGLTATDPANCGLAFCLPTYHGGEGADVAFIGGNVQWFSCTTNKPFLELRIELERNHHSFTFQEVTNNLFLYYEPQDQDQLAELKKRTRIIYPKRHL